MPKPRAFKTAAEAIASEDWSKDARTIAVQGTLCQDGEGFLISHPGYGKILVDADGCDYQTRVYCVVDGGEEGEDKYRLVLEPFGTEPS